MECQRNVIVLLISVPWYKELMAFIYSLFLENIEYLYQNYLPKLIAKQKKTRLRIADIQWATGDDFKGEAGEDMDNTANHG